MIILLRVDLSQEDVGQVGSGRIVVSETGVPIPTVGTTNKIAVRERAVVFRAGFCLSFYYCIWLLGNHFIL